MPEDKGPTTESRQNNSRSQREEKILQFWKDRNIFQKTLEKKSSAGDFIFFEGPPTANGKPGIHHLEARAFKDVIPRYKTMRGYHVNRKAGWDTHGLPVEIQAEKTLGLKSKKEIEEFGVAKFNAECKRSVGEYIDLWRDFTRRIGYWVNMDDAYFTYHNSYIESVWKILAHVEKRKLLYKDYKVVPWCPRCGTGLSSHELAQGYQDVKDLSLYVKFKIIGFPDAYFLAWTTTPWTLPGNVGLAVGPEIDYVEIKVGGEILVLAKNKLSVITEPYEIVAEHKGSEMVGMSYEPLYPFIKDLPAGKAGETGKGFKVYPADFVTTEDGTGIVHTAVMYGQEDFDLGNKVGLPKVHLVNPDGTFMKGTDWLEGRSVVDETLAVEILKDLQNRGLLFGKENYNHSYPFCWRCNTRLIYYARDSWYIGMSKLRDELVKENEKINWEPEYIKEGRFGEWLREVKDWAISRERFWGTPLPVWQSESGDRLVVDSIETLKKYSKTNKNRFIGMRHGEAGHNVSYICSASVDFPDHLTEKGKKEVIESAVKLKKEGITKIITSPFVRARETAELVAKEIGLPIEQIILDERIREYGFGIFDQQSRKLYDKWRLENNSIEAKPNDGESVGEAKMRFADFFYETEKKYKNEVILFVSHGIGFEVIPPILSGYNKQETWDKWESNPLYYGQTKEYSFISLPHNENYELDLHKPFIDEIELEKDGKVYKRVKEVMDVWFDSGSVPFSQDPKAEFKPADFISEAIDQTRGWFYTLHAIGVLMEKGKVFKNVICLGLLMDKDGKKMSKSVGNVVDPLEMIEKYGADTLRMWMYSVNQPGDSKNFDEKTVDEINRKVFNLLDNVYAFYELYRDKNIEVKGKKIKSENILDQWIMVRLEELINTMSTKLDSYKLLEPTRAIRDFMDDLSTWYLRRSRDRLKDEAANPAELAGARETLYFVLKTVSKLLAPFAPFSAEDLYQKLRTESDPESVHLETWPEKQKDSIFSFLHKKSAVTENMKRTREIVTQALEARSKANIKVRQPLASLSVKLDGAYLDLIKDEVNVKVVMDKNIEGVELDTKLSPELIEEGKVRDIIRVIQEMRKEKNLKPTDKIDYQIPETDRELALKNKKQIEEVTNVNLV